MRIGIDLGGTKIEAILMDDCDAILERRRVVTPANNYAATLAAITDLVTCLEEPLPKPANIGIATPGSISQRTGKMKNCNSTCLNGKRLLEDLQHLLSRELRIANDADCFTLSEATDGAAANVNTVFGVILGTGVGGGVCVQAQLLNGPNRITGEWGHNPLPKTNLQRHFEDARNCYCGRKDCIETYLSGPGFEFGYQLASGEKLSAAAIVTQSKTGDKNAIEQLNHYYERLASSLSVIINLLDPDMIVLGGGLSKINGLYEQVPKRWENYVFSDSCATLLSPAKYGDSSGVRGAAWLWPS